MANHATPKHCRDAVDEAMRLGRGQKLKRICLPGRTKGCQVALPSPKFKYLPYPLLGHRDGLDHARSRQVKTLALDCALLKSIPNTTSWER